MANAAPQFVLGKASDVGQPQTVQKLAKVDTYLVSYVDGEGKPQVRLAFTIPGTQTSYIIQERITGVHVVTEGTPWFSKALAQKIADGKGDESLTQV